MSTVDTKSKMMPLVSILMPVYNGRAYVASAIESCLAQTYGNFELIIIDDGSTDGSDAVIEEFLNNKLVRHAKQPNGGRSSACNTGLELAKGSLIAFCDADDLMHKDKLELQVAVMETYPEIGLLHTARTAINSTGETIGHQHTRDKGIDNIEVYEATKRLFHRNYICGPTAMIRRKCLDEIGNFDELVLQSQDHELWLRLSTRYKFGYLNQELYGYRKHDGQITHNREKREFYKEHVLREFMKNYPNFITKNDMDIALANIHKSRGHELIKQDKEPAAARREFRKSLSFKPINPSVWLRYLRTYLN